MLSFKRINSYFTCIKSIAIGYSAPFLLIVIYVVQINKIPRIPQSKPSINPTKISKSDCCFNTIRALPKKPERRIKTDSHKSGLNLNIKLYDKSPPTISPPLVTRVLIFHQKLLIKQKTIQISEPIIIPVM